MFKKKVVYFLGAFLEKVHLPGVALVLGLGRLWISGFLYFCILILVIGLQAWKKECPVNPIVVRLKRKYQPQYQYFPEKTFICRFFNRFGRIGAIYLLLFWIIISYLMIWIFA